MHDLLESKRRSSSTTRASGSAWRSTIRTSAFLALGKEHGFDFVIAPIPHRSALRGACPFDLLVQRIGEHARARGIEVVDLLPGLLSEFGAAPERAALPYDGHYTGGANRVMARDLARALAPRIRSPR